MAGNREQADNGVGRAAIRPTASPVDTFVRPEQNSGLSQLAESLKGIAPEVAKYSDVVAQRQSDTQKAAGEQKARELFESGTSYKDAIKKGLISPQESPWFQLGAKEQFGRVTAGKYSSDLKDAVEKDPTLQESTDVAQYDKFATDFRKKWLADNVGDENRGLNFEHGFGSMADAYSADARSQFVAQAGQRLVKVVGDRHYAEVFQMLDHETSMHTDPAAMAQAWNLINDRAIATGMNPRAANLAGVKALGDLVARDGDTTMFDILKQVKTGSGSLYATAAAQEEIQKVTEKVFVDKQRRASAEEQADTRARADATRIQMSGIATQLIQSANPSRENIDSQLATLARLNPEAAENMVHFKDAMTSSAFASNTNAVHNTVADIFTKPEGDSGYVDVHSLVNLVNAHQINQQDFSFLHSQIDLRDEAARREKNEAREHNVYTDPQFTHSMASLKTLIGNEFDWKPETSQRIDGAVSEFGKYWLEYMAGPGKTATPIEKNQFLVDMQQQVAEKWRPPDTKAGASQPGIPKIDLRSPAGREQATRMLDLVQSQIRGGSGFSPGVINWLNNNGVTIADAPAFLKMQRSLIPKK